MTAPFTNLTADLWRWNEWLALEHDPDDMIGRCTKLFWLALYTSHDAKRSVPGIFCGSITTMAESARVRVDDAIKYLDRLLEHEMVEFDQENRVLRLTKLPGFGDAAGSNGKVIKGWWTQFNRVPQCAVRDAHVSTLKWMLEEWRRFKGEPLTPDQAKAWAETFGRVTIPAPRKRGVRRLLDADTSTDTQPSLFGAPPSPSNSLPGGPDTLSRTHQISSEARSGTNLQLSDSSNLDTLSKPFREGLINPPDPDPDFGSGTGT